MKVRQILLLLLLPLCSFGEDQDKVYRVGGGVSAPRVLHKFDPEYSKEAERERIQGTALYSLIVDKSGRPRDIELVSPIGYGLDEKGLEAIRKWEFEPARKDRTPVSVQATIEINFRFPAIPFDSKEEARRTSYNVALRDFEKPDRRQKAIESIQQLAQQNYPPAMSMLGDWMMIGRDVPKDGARGLELIQKAAAKYDRGALYVLGMLYVTGQEVPKDAEKGAKLLREASTYGSTDAQLYLGRKYAGGDATTDADPERARNYFRLCAARGMSKCQFELGRMLMPVAGGAKGDPVQALAWLELATNAGVKEAGVLAASTRDSLTQEDQQRAEKLMPQLIRH